MSLPLPSKPTKSQLVSAVSEATYCGSGDGAERIRRSIKSAKASQSNLPRRPNHHIRSEWRIRFYRFTVLGSDSSKFHHQLNRKIQRPDELREPSDNKVSSGNLIYIASNPAEVVAKTHGLPAQAIVEIFPVYIDQPQIGQTQAACQVRWVIVSGGGGGNTQFVTLRNDGGTQGSSGTTPALLTYSGYLTNGTQIFSNLLPARNPYYAPVTAARIGQVTTAWNGQFWSSSTTDNSSLKTSNNPMGYSIIDDDEVEIVGGC